MLALFDIILACHKFIHCKVTTYFSYTQTKPPKYVKKFTTPQNIPHVFLLRQLKYLRQLCLLIIKKPPPE